MARELHKNEERGIGDIAWLKSRFSFSFADYYNPKRMGFGKLRVLNDDIIAPENGFGMHPHNDMEIITIVLSGKLEHSDSLSNKTILVPGDIQVMSAGSGIVHSEINASETDELKLLQLWIEPDKKGHTPRHEEKKLNLEKNKITKIVSGKKDSNTLFINQDANLFLCEFDKNKEEEILIGKNNGLFVFVINGSIEIDNLKLNQRDSFEISNEDKIKINFLKDSKVLLIEVPM